MDAIEPDEEPDEPATITLTPEMLKQAREQAMAPSRVTNDWMTEREVRQWMRDETTAAELLSGHFDKRGEPPPTSREIEELEGILQSRKFGRLVDTGMSRAARSTVGPLIDAATLLSIDPDDYLTKLADVKPIPNATVMALKDVVEQQALSNSVLGEMAKLAKKSDRSTTWMLRLTVLVVFLTAVGIAVTLLHR